MIKRFFTRLYNLFIAPKSEERDVARKEFIFNTIISGTIVLSFSGFAFNGLDFLFDPAYNNSRINPLVTLIFTVIFCVLLYLSRNRKYFISAGVFVIFLLLGAVYTNFRWGTDAGQALLLYALITLASSVLVSNRFAFFITLFETAAMLILTYFQSNHLYSFDQTWKERPLTMDGAMFFVLTLLFILVVSWLSNRETEKALDRARNSEEELKKEKDLLEIKVVQRTQELRKAEMEKMTQVYHFAEVGRITSGLFHDLVNPLNLISLNLDKLYTQTKNDPTLNEAKTNIQRALLGTKRLGDFVDMARKQIQNQELYQKFSLIRTTKECIQMLEHKAKTSNVKVVFHYDEDHTYFGNPIKFSQVVINLIRNAIESYNDEKNTSKQEVHISIVKKTKKIIIEVKDWGRGISEEIANKVFEPFFSTKTNNTGIGLFSVKDIVEKNLKGKIYFTNNSEKGAIFVVEIPEKKS
jgi:signal transduction histidine kinase